MKPEQKVTSLELSKALKEAGAVQESEKVWKTLTQISDSISLKTRLDKNYDEPDSCFAEFASAFDVSELLERLPDGIDINGWTCSWSLTPDGACYESFHETGPEAVEGSRMFEDTPAEALGELYLWCLKEGHVKP